MSDEACFALYEALWQRRYSMDEAFEVNDMRVLMGPRTISLTREDRHAFWSFELPLPSSERQVFKFVRDTLRVLQRMDRAARRKKGAKK